jgi:hypothetical protein
MEPEGSLPFSEEPAVGPCPEPDESSLHHRAVALRSVLILSSKLGSGLQSGLVPWDLFANIMYAFVISPMRATFLAPFHSAWFYHPK